MDCLGPLCGATPRKGHMLYGYGRGSVTSEPERPMLCCVPGIFFYEFPIVPVFIVPIVLGNYDELL